MFRSYEYWFNTFKVDQWQLIIYKAVINTVFKTTTEKLVQKLKNWLFYNVLRVLALNCANLLYFSKIYLLQFF